MIDLTHIMMHSGDLISLEIIESIEALKGWVPDDVIKVTFGLSAGMLVAAGVEKDYQKALIKLQKRTVIGH